MAKQVPKKKGANGYKLPDPLPKGEILEDIAKKKWKLGASIGQGGFGEIYMAQEADSKSTSFPYVIKIEPHENGPLFVEINFYIRNAKPLDVDNFENKKKLKTLGMPKYIGSGSHKHKNQKYRFLVMPKFGTDIWKIFLENGRKLPTATVFKLGVQILDVLEYIHERGYVHADIKGANVLLGLSKENKDQSYLVDFGLATKYQLGKEFKPNPKRAHDGTIEYLSRDAHLGVPTRRGDIEILAYNLIQWLGCKLPWETDLSKPESVQASKEEHMSNVGKFLKLCFGSKKIPAGLTELLKYVNTLTFDANPDYVKIRKMLVSEIEGNNETLSSPLIFDNVKQTSPSKRKIEQKKNNTKKLKTEEVDQDLGDLSRVTIRKPKIQPKLMKAVSTEDVFEGYTPEMKAIAMKKQNGVKKPRKNVEKVKNSAKNGEPLTTINGNGVKKNVEKVENSAKIGESLKTINENEVLNMGRTKRNVKAVNYKEPGMNF